MKLLVLTVGFMAALPVHALELDGNVGVAYARSDSFAPDGIHATDPRLTLNLGLQARGFYYRPDTFEWMLGGAYRRLDWKPAGGGSAFEQWLFYDARTAFLTRATYPVSLTLDASRGHTEFSSSTSATVTGDSVTQDVGGLLILRIADRPTVSAGYHHFDTSTNTPGIGVTDRRADQVTGSLSTGTTAFRVSANYAGLLREGPYASDNTDQHAVNVSLTAPISSSADVLATEQYLLASPREFVPGSVKQETNVFRLFGSNRGGPGEARSASFSYAHTLTEFFGTQLEEGTRQALHAEGDALLTRSSLFTRWMVDGSLLQARSGPTELRTTGETAGVQLNWNHATDSRAYEASAGPTVGFIQSDTAGDSTGWGTSAAARVRFAWGPGSANVRYSFDYARDIFGSPGWAVRQSVSAGIGGPIGSVLANASLTGSGYRTQSPLYGAGLGRSIVLVASAFADGTSADLNVSLQQGVAGSSPTEVIGDGLFIPSPFDSRTFNATLRGSTRLYSGLTASAHLRYLNTSYPNQPDINQYEVLAALRYAYGALTFALEDRLTRYEQSNGWATANLAMVMFSRTIGWRDF